MPTPTCITGSLAAYVPDAQVPWHAARARHLFRRLGFGAHHTTIQQALTRSPGELVEELIDAALQRPQLAAPTWADWTIFDYDTPDGRDFDLIYQHAFEYGYEVLKDMVGGGLREKLTLFWTNHFVTEFEGYQSPQALFQYHQLCQEYALGNFQDFTHAMGLNLAMLVYLNNNQNTKAHPNENYARELYELFTLGQDIGYTQQDIVETARAITGWYTDDGQTVNFDPIRHDHDSKTIFGQTGNWGYDDVIQILFTQRPQEIARFICRKLYQYFVYPEADPQLIDDLAQTFIQHNFEIAPVLRRLLKSEHFFSDEAVGVQIKAPLELMFQQLNEIGFPFESYAADLYWGAYSLGQQLFSPIDVAGWQGHHKWISTSLLTDRWQIMSYIHYLAAEFHGSHFRAWARAISPSETDPELITQAIIDTLFPRGLEDPTAYERAAIVFRGEVPVNYFEDGSWNLDWPQAAWQLFHLLSHLARLPEFQLT